MTENSPEMNRQARNHGTLLQVLLLITVFLSALTKIHDLDAWIHLTMGRLIWETKGMPDTEPFVYTMLGKPFSYSSWLFGVLYYLVYKLFSIYGVILLKATTVTLAFFILLRDSLRPYRNTIVAVCVMLVVFIMSRHRFVERPDTFLMIFLPFSIYSLNAYVYDGKKFIYALPLVHLLWANSHSSINLMFIPFSAFLIGGVLLRSKIFDSLIKLQIAPAPSYAQLRTILIIFIALFAASLISPYSVGQYTFGAKFLASAWFKQEILELKPPTWGTFKSLYLFTALIIASFFLNLKRFHLIYAILAIPFAVLAFTSIRFIFLFAIVAGPIISRNISSWVDALCPQEGVFSFEKFAAGLVALTIIISALLVIPTGAPLQEENKELGFGSINTAPEGALRYMDSRDISGRVFNLFQWGQYISWRDYPKRTVFIDGRGYFPESMLEDLDRARMMPAVLDRLHAQYGFESILLDYPIDKEGVTGFNYDIDKSLQHPGWALVYWDDVSLLYLRRGGLYDSVIRKDEYRFIKPANQIEGVKARLRRRDFRENLIKELQRNISQTGSLRAMVFLGYVYNELGQYDKAIDIYSEVIGHGRSKNLLSAYYGIAFAYGKIGDFKQSLNYYKKALGLGESAALHYKTGRACMSLDDHKTAAEHFTKALKLDPNLVTVYPLLISTYKKIGQNRKAEKVAMAYENAKQSAAGEEHFREGLRAYFEKKYDAAVSEFLASIEKNPSNPAPYSNLGYIYYDIGFFEKAYEYQRRAIEVDPDFANAHYGLAMLYKKWGG